MGRVGKALIVLRERALRVGSFARRRPRLQWALKISAPADASGDLWGDVFFAHDLATALRSLGQTVHVDRYATRDRPVQRMRDDVVVHLVGLRRPEIVPGAVNILWLISHPEMVTEDELAQPFDLRFAASESWAKKHSAPGRPVLPLLQATDPGRFTPTRSGSEIASDVLFVGKTRAIFRPIVRDAIAAGADLAIYGDGWPDFIDPRFVRADFLDNERVPDAYRGARVVLNDHWQDMADEGFASNRLFDAVAAGAIVVSDSVDGVPVEFGGMVRAYGSVEELRALLDAEGEGDGDAGWPTPSERRRAAAAVAEKHSFARRAEVLLAAAVQRRRSARVRAPGGSRR